MDSQTFKYVQYVIDDFQNVIYFKDKFALDQMAETCSVTKSIKVLKQGFPRFLSKPLIKKLFQQAGSGFLSAENFEQVMPTDYSHFLLTLSKWGHKPRRNSKDGFFQTSRSGFSLVLQLNFGFDHDIEFYRYMIPKPKRNLGFNFNGHPVHKGGLRTMSWARIDFDFQTNEALIEEVQSDWFGLLKARVMDTDLAWMSANHFHEKSQISLYQHKLKKHEKLWPEATLHTAVNFIRKELGIDTIWMHSNETGKVFKEITERLPPTSLYSKLPKAYGFKEVDEQPDFLKQEKYLKPFFRKTRDAKWFFLERN